MMFNTLTTTAVAALSLAMPGAMASPKAARGLDVQLKWHSSNNCGDSGGPVRDYAAGSCLDLSGDTRGVEIINRSGGCYIVAYDDGTCNAGGRKLDDNGCWTLQGKNSVAFKC